MRAVLSRDTEDGTDWPMVSGKFGLLSDLEDNSLFTWGWDDTQVGSDLAANVSWLNPIVS
jgi:hypothetical protein